MARVIILRTCLLLGSIVLLIAGVADVSGEPASAPQSNASTSDGVNLTIPLPGLRSLATSTALPNSLAVTFENYGTPLYSIDGGIRWYAVPTIPWQDTSASLLAAISPRADPSAPVRLLIAASTTDPSRVGVYRTGDYGRTWAKSSFPHPAECNEPDQFTELTATRADPYRLYLIKVCYHVDIELYVAFSGVYSSSDAGVTWQPIKADGVGNWSGLTPSPSISSRVYLRDTFGSWLQSDNNGQTWTSKSFPIDSLALDAVDPTHLHGIYNVRINGNTVGHIGRRSQDGGNTWSNWSQQPCLYSGAEAELLAHPAAANVLLLRCGPGLFRSIDGGDHWSQLSTWRGQRIEADLAGRILWTRNDGLWKISDQTGAFSQLTDSYQSAALPWRNVSTPDSTASINSVTPLSADNVWAVGEQGTILHWRGSEWSRVTSPVTATLWSTAFVSPTDGWAVGDSTILHWNGEQWEPTDLPQPIALKSVDVVSSTDAWAVGDAGAIRHWNGNAWEVVSSPTPLPLLAVDMVSQQDGWAVGGRAINDEIGWYSGAILRWNGSSWSTVTTPNYIVASVDMLSAADGWMVGGTDWANGGKILRWNGTAWQEVTHPGVTLLRSVAMVSESDGWAAGSLLSDGQPTLLHWDGTIWTRPSIPTSRLPWTTAALAPTSAWITGQDDGWMLVHERLLGIQLPLIIK